MAESYEKTDWARIIGYYDALLELTGGSTVVAMNRAVALMEHSGSAIALGEFERLERLDPMKYNRILASLLAECHRRLGNKRAAKRNYETSIKASQNDVLTNHWAELGSIWTGTDGTVESQTIDDAPFNQP